MNNTVNNLTSLLELPGLSNLVKGYTTSSINVDNKFLNRKQFRNMKHGNTSIVFCYGDLVLINPVQMFYESRIHTFTSKGTISLTGNSTHMFSGSQFNSDISKWNVDKVTDMSCMFWSATLFNSDISKWNVGNVEYMFRMFYGAKSFSSDLSGWNVENVIDVNGMFYGAISFNSDLSKWNVSRVVSVDEMFRNAFSFTSDLSGWNFERLRYKTYTFRGTKSFGILLPSRF